MESLKDMHERPSAFWGLFRNLDVHFGHDGGGMFRAVVWSNLYRLAPHSHRANPPEWNCAAQREQAATLLYQEMKTLRPGVAVFLTGGGWFREFLDTSSLGKHMRGSFLRGGGYVRWHGRFGPTRVVVAEHPQGKVGGAAHLAKNICRYAIETPRIDR